jgi:ADP-ribose pyrophosphatase YjhB (NUDIX family)
MMWKPNVTVAAVVERDGRFLFVEEAADGRLVLNQPAGHLDEGESLIDAVIRETFEETAWHFRPDFLVGIYRWPHPEKPVTYLRFAFAGHVLRHEPDRRLDDGIVQAVWLTPTELRAASARQRSPLVQQCLDDYLEGRRYALDVLTDLDEARA